VELAAPGQPFGPALSCGLALMLDRVGNYILEAELGRGALGVVFRARHAVLGHRVAIKTLLTGDRASPAARARFLREARAAASLRHPGIVPVHDLGEERGAAFVVMELIEGEGLGARLGRGPLPVREAVELTRQVATALHHAHLHGVVHRDVKPDNILVDRDGAARLTDFGIARVEDEPGQTKSGVFVGTPAYAAPEQLLGGRVDARTDVYALGGTLFALLTGRPPFDEAESMVVHVAQVCGEGPPRPSSFRPEVSPALDEVVLRCLAKRPDDRFATANDLAAAIGLATGSELAAGSALEKAPGVRARRPRRTRRTAWSLAAAGGLLLLLGALVASTRQGAPAPLRPPEPAPLPLPPVAPAADRTTLPLDPAAHRLLEQAEGRRRAGELDEALAAVESAVAMAPDRSEPLALRGFIRLERRELVAARGDLDRAHELAPGDATVLSTRAGLRRLQGDEAGALADYGEALALAPDDLVAAFGRAQLLSARGDAASALADLDRVLAARPDGSDDELVQVEALIARAMLHGRAGRFDAAVGDAERALQLDPRSGHAYRVRAEVRIARGDTSGAESDLRRALELLPAGDSSVLATRALLDQVTGRETADVGDDPQALVVRASAREARGELVAARADCDRALERRPDFAQALRLRGQIRLRSGGDDGGALADLDRAVALSPDPVAHVHRGIARKRLGDLRGALADDDAALALEPGSALALENRAYVRQALGDREGALADLDRLVEQAPADVRLRVVRAVVRQEVGRSRDALDDLQVALAAEPSHLRALANRAHVRMALGDAAGARADADAVLLAVDDDVVRAVRAAACEVVGDLVGAARDYEHLLGRPGVDEGSVRLALERCRAAQPSGSR
jgi:tetratricopeptide (TPR) repeat protein